MYDAEGPKTGHVAALTADGARVWGSVHDAQQVQEMAALGIEGGVIGKPVTIASQVAALG